MNELKRLELLLSSVRPEHIIHNTEDGVRRMQEVRRDTWYYGREVAMRNIENVEVDNGTNITRV